jgi:predicted dehydrogenase
MFPGVANISKKETEFPNSDALLNQILSFTEAVINDSEPLVSGKDGLEALKTAVQITTKIHDNLSVKYAKS